MSGQGQIRHEIHAEVSHLEHNSSSSPSTAVRPNNGDMAPLPDSALSGSHETNPTFMSVVYGRLGAICNGVLTLTPNMDLLYKPPTENVSVSIRKDYRFGLDDPLLHPQPLIPAVLHLCVIRSPTFSAENSLSFMWKALIPDNFDNSSVKYLALGFETLRDEIRSEYRRHVVDLFNEIEHFCRDHGEKRQEIRSDPWMKTYEYLTLDALSLLRLPGPRWRLSLYFIQAQRIYLEFRARFEWLTVFRPVLRNEGLTASCSEPANVIGAFVSTIGEMKDMCRAGIPVWLVKPESALEELTIESYGAFTVPHEDSWPARDNSGFFDISQALDDIPLPHGQHRVIYTGRGAELARYEAMSRFQASLAAYGLMGHPQENSSTAPSSGPSRSRTERTERHFSRNAPYSREQTSRKKSNDTTPARNKFIIPDSPSLPTPLANWKTALAELAPTAPTQPKPQGRYHPGYWCPEIAMFISPANEATKAALFGSWLHLRDILLYRLRCPALSTPLNPSQWRTILSLPMIKFTPREDGEMRRNRLRSADICYALLEKFAKEGGRELDMEQIRAFLRNPPEWRGQTLSLDSSPPPDIAKQILWEISELNFRFDFISLDSILHVWPGNAYKLASVHHQPLLRRERLAELNRCWPDSATEVYEESLPESIASDSLMTRFTCLHIMADMMATWCDAPTFLKPDNRPMLRSLAPAEQAEKVDEFELKIARFYTSSFLNVFGREASIPFRI